MHLFLLHPVEQVEEYNFESEPTSDIIFSENLENNDEIENDNENTNFQEGFEPNLNP